MSWFASMISHLMNRGICTKNFDSAFCSIVWSILVISVLKFIDLLLYVHLIAFNENSKLQVISLSMDILFKCHKYFVTSALTYSFKKLEEIFSFSCDECMVDYRLLLRIYKNYNCVLKIEMLQYTFHFLRHECIINV